MRLLTDYELDLVAGGNTYSDSQGYITVVAGGGGGGGIGGFDPGSGGGSGGGSGTTPPNDPPPNAPTPADTHIDCVAKHMADQIAQKSDNHYMEYEGLIYVTPDGSVHASNILANGQSGGSTTTSHSYEDYGVPDNGYIIGIVHNHPDQVLQDPSTGATEPVSNPTLAADPSYLDMKSLDDLHAAYSQYSGYPFDPNDLRSYISFNGQTSEYDWKDQDWSHLSGGNTGQAPWAQKSNFEPACEN